MINSGRVDGGTNEELADPDTTDTFAQGSEARRGDVLAHLADMILEIHRLAKRYGEADVANKLREAYVLANTHYSEERLNDRR